MKPWETITRTTVRLECQKYDGPKITGTGFLYVFENENGRIPGIISNKHLLELSEKVVFYVSVKKKDEEPDGIFEVITIEVGKDAIFVHPNNDIDLAFLPLAALFNRFDEDYYEYFQFRQENIVTAEDHDEIDAIEEIFLIGYPNGLWDSQNNLPIARRGITASSMKEMFEGKNIFLIDSSCYPGSSGSPVIWYQEATIRDHIEGRKILQNKFKLTGILYAIFQYSSEGTIKIKNIPDNWIDFTRPQIPMNIGLCIKAEEINTLGEIVLNDYRAEYFG